MARETEGLRFGPFCLPRAAATGHFLVAGTTGSGKSLVQRYLMADALADIRPGSDQRALIFDAKGDTSAFLQHVGVDVPIYSFNPFEWRNERPTCARWDIAADITSSARAFNLGAILIPDEKGGGNRYFTDAARQVLVGLVESFIRHSKTTWTFSDLVTASLQRAHIEEVLRRDSNGQAVLDAFFGDDRTSYQVFTTIVSRMSYYRPVAGLWQHTSASLSIRSWLKDESILLLGSDATSEVALSAINELIFRTIVEEIDCQTNSDRRRTWVWLDEARLAGPLLKSGMLSFLAVKGRSAGAALVMAFQDIDGFREAAGERLANELIAQCSHKALLRMESEAGATWASRLIGQHETLERFRSERGGRSKTTHSEQRVQRDTVLASQFFGIPVTSKANGLTGYFLSPYFGVTKHRMQPNDLQRIVVPADFEYQHRIIRRPERDQLVTGWQQPDYQRLSMLREVEHQQHAQQPRRKRLRLARREA